MSVAVVVGCSDDSRPMDDQACCDPAEEPGTNGNPVCIEGASCCADGTWQCNQGDGQPTCAELAAVCRSTACCDPAEEPGTNGNPFCFEGASCCADGTWQCNDFGGNPSCADHDLVCQ